MKRYAKPILLGFGWVMLGIYLLSGYYFNKLSLNANASPFSPIAWEDHVQLFDGALQCKLSDVELLERKKFLKDKIFQNVVRKEEVLNGFVYYLEDEDSQLQYILEFVQKEKACCPFFKFDISILPFKKGIAMQISGSEEAFEFLKDFEENDF